MLFRIRCSFALSTLHTFTFRSGLFLFTPLALCITQLVRAKPSILPVLYLCARRHSISLWTHSDCYVGLIVLLFTGPPSLTTLLFRSCYVCRPILRHQLARVNKYNAVMPRFMPRLVSFSRGSSKCLKMRFWLTGICHNGPNAW